jgi:hypothetical protein
MLEDLLGHQLAGADPAIIVSRAIDRLLNDTLKKKAAVTDDARQSDRRNNRRTRAIPAVNIALRCRAHNQYQADLDFGKDFMRGKRRSNNPHSARHV